MHARLLAALLLALACPAAWPGGAMAAPAPPSPGDPVVEMAITFDDLPAHGPLPPGMTRLDVARSLLATLRAERLPPTWGFVNGARQDDDPTASGALAAWREAGQPLGNHTWSHGDINDEPAGRFIADVRRNEPLLARLMAGEDWRWLRYPYLHEGDTRAKRRAVRRWLAVNGYRVAQTSMDFEDYQWNAPYARCRAQHDERGVQRLHDGYLAAAARAYDGFRAASRLAYGRDIRYVLLMHVGAFDARMLPELLALYRARGVRFVSLEEAMADPAYRDDPDIGSRHGGTHLELVLESRHQPFPGDMAEDAALADICPAGG